MKIEYNPKYVTVHKVPGQNAKTIFTCPVCKGSFSIRQFKEHVKAKHALDKDRIGAELFGLEYPVKCSVCHEPIHFDVDQLVYPTKHRICPSKAKLMASKPVPTVSDCNKRLDDIAAQIKKLKDEQKRIAKEKSVASKAAVLDSTTFDELPLKVKDRRFLVKMERTLRMAVVEHCWDQVTKCVNALQVKLSQ